MPSSCCSARSILIFAPRNKNGEIRKGCPAIRLRLFLKVATWSGSRKNAAREISTVSLPMPDSPDTYLAFDLGAESGRAVLARINSGVISTDEVHRFANQPVEYAGAFHWDVLRLWWEFRTTLSRLAETHLNGI